MSLGEQYPSLRKRVHLGRLHLWMPTKTTDPVVEIVDRNEENIGPVFGSEAECWKQDNQAKEVAKCSHAMDIRLPTKRSTHANEVAGSRSRAMTPYRRFIVT